MPNYEGWVSARMEGQKGRKHTDGELEPGCWRPVHTPRSRDHRDALADAGDITNSLYKL